jgi:hypothetical protein
VDRAETRTGDGSGPHSVGIVATQCGAERQRCIVGGNLGVPLPVLEALGGSRRSRTKGTPLPSLIDWLIEREREREEILAV